MHIWHFGKAVFVGSKLFTFLPFSEKSDWAKALEANMNMLLAIRIVNGAIITGVHLANEG